MTRNILRALLLAATVIVAPTARADYEAGQRAWETGRPDVALSEWRSAAASGDRRAMLALGRLFVQGLGAPQDYVEAHMWLNLAAARGEVAAARERNALAAKMTPEQVATAQARATGWRPAGAASAPAAAASTGTPKEASQTAISSPAPSGGKVIATIAELAIKGVQAYMLVKLMEDPEKIAGVTPELRKLLGKMVSGVSAADLSNKEDAQISLGSLTAAERGDLSDLLKKDQGLPQPTRDALSGALRAKAAVSAIALRPKCAGAAKGSRCWESVANKPGCLVWDNYYRPDQTVTWSGSCSGSMVAGQGSLTWQTDGGTHTGTGTIVDGRQQGQWVVRYADGTVGEGPYVDGKPQGQWVFRYPSGRVDEGPLVDGKQQGRWVWRFANGEVHEGPLVDGKRQGRWVWRSPNGNVEEGPLADGTRQGRWVIRYAGTVAEGSFVDGKRHGRWVWRFADGTVEEGRYVDGKKQ